jgi:hypothetical protein
MTMTRLRRLAQAAPAAVERVAAEPEEQCELCSEPIAPVHRHLLDLHTRRLLCACRGCSILFDSPAAGHGHYRLVPAECRYLDGFELDDALWQSLRVPVEMAFFFESSAAERVVAFYPSPVGATESLLELPAWKQLAARNPILRELEPDVEALLVNRVRGAREHWAVPVDRCYELVGLIRSGWKGFGGGHEVWEEIDRFFDRLRREAVTVTTERREAT